MDDNLKFFLVVLVGVVVFLSLLWWIARPLL
jgi:hypothetical protein